MDPLLIDVPARLPTERLILRCPRPGDGPLLHEAEHETLEDLRLWMVWAHTPRSPDEAEAYCRRMQAQFILRGDLVWFAFERDATGGLARLAFDALDARRVELRMDDSNVASWRVAERCGFTLEALLRGDSLTPAGAVRSTRIYARVRGIEEPV